MAEHKRKKRVTPYEKAVNYLSQIEYIEEMIGEKQPVRKVNVCRLPLKTV